VSHAVLAAVQLARRLEAVEDWHLTVHEDGGGAPFASA